MVRKIKGVNHQKKFFFMKHFNLERKLDDISCEKNAVL